MVSKINMAPALMNFILTAVGSRWKVLISAVTWYSLRKTMCCNVGFDVD